MELKTKNEIINNLFDTQSAIVESLSLAKQQNSQAASFFFSVVYLTLALNSPVNIYSLIHANKVSKATN